MGIIAFSILPPPTIRRYCTAGYFNAGAIPTTYRIPCLLYTSLGADGAVGIIKWKDNLIETVEDRYHGVVDVLKENRIPYYGHNLSYRW